MFSVANALILTKIKQALGLDQTVAFYFGAAPLR
jgi:long-subunit acyl-CoA synthetase (AMP-forming)